MSENSHTARSASLVCVEGLQCSRSVLRLPLCGLRSLSLPRRHLGTHPAFRSLAATGPLPSVPVEVSVLVISCKWNLAYRPVRGWLPSLGIVSSWSYAWWCSTSLLFVAEYCSLFARSHTLCSSLPSSAGLGFHVLHFSFFSWLTPFYLAPQIALGMAGTQLSSGRDLFLVIHCCLAGCWADAV